ncbi:MAG: aminotransferase class I/II-fold pyridoxal phosphate-dependent enzyme, partial [Actinomycetota bacterium]|nr:aminotransferase class I/II-fold pyridoxal phosphate-dependent enzyme [Actinomycetota bacterium]
GYPAYEMGTLLAGAEPYFLPRKRENAFLPVLDSIPSKILRRSKVLWINYHNNPTGAVAEIDFFQKAVDFARKHDLVLCHDNAYSEITYDGFVAPSILEVEGAKEVAIEFFSLSKSYNMTGWRIGFATGNADVIEALSAVKTNVDSGIFNPVQKAGIKALEDEGETTIKMGKIYQKRRDMLVNGFLELGWDVIPPRGSIYIWLPVPSGFDSVGFSEHLLETAGVFFTPGNAYGASGEGYMRVSMTVTERRIEAALSRIKKAFKANA